MLFSGLIWWIYEHHQGPGSGVERAGEFLTGYVVEWSLSMDNVFVFLVIFRHFRVPPQYQYRVLFWGILAAVFLRLAFVLAGAAILHHFEWTMYLLGAFLVYTGVMVAIEDDDLDPEQGLVLRLSRRWLPVSHRGPRRRVCRATGWPTDDHAAVPGAGRREYHRHRVRRR